MKIDKRCNLKNTETHRQCADCGAVKERSEFYIARGNHDGLVPYCKPCTQKRNRAAYQASKVERKRRRDELKRELVDSMGGCCSHCGYDTYLAGLDFHHLGGKDEEVARLVTNASSGNDEKLEILRAEAGKCIILCRNCHMALHAGEWE